MLGLTPAITCDRTKAVECIASKLGLLNLKDTKAGQKYSETKESMIKKEEQKAT